MTRRIVFSMRHGIADSKIKSVILRFCRSTKQSAATVPPIAIMLALDLCCDQLYALSLQTNPVSIARPSPPKRFKQRERHRAEEKGLGIEANVLLRDD